MFLLLFLLMAVDFLISFLEQKKNKTPGRASFIDRFIILNLYILYLYISIDVVVVVIC